MKRLLQKHADKIRFAIVGCLNTIIDFGVLFILVGLGVPIIVGNFISTSSALIFSFFANKKFTFRNKEKMSKKQLTYFLVITLFGLWVIQPIIITITSILLKSWLSDVRILLVIEKLLATCVTLVWNYLLYRKFVFKER